jgi:two-component system NtrC family response regulator
MSPIKSTAKKSILFIGSKEDIDSRISKAIVKEFKIHTAKTSMRVFNILDKYHPTIVLLNLDLKDKFRQKKDDLFNLEFLKKIATVTPYTKVIVISDAYKHREALKAIALGAFDYYPKPIDTKELETIIRRAGHLFNLEEENWKLHQPQEGENYFFDIVGKCREIMDVYSIIRRVADTGTTVLVCGKSGTGKELVARAIHNYSQRKDHPFVAINCGAIPETLLESELFGHEKGSFTGAEAQRIGKLESANLGTVFLDEIGELSILLQVKILRFLQDKVIERIGGRVTINIDTRIIAATNKNLKEEVKRGGFREDLFFRLSVIPVTLPPLKNRGEDIILLANYFLQKYKQESKLKIIGFSKELISLILQYEWPGNIRELENRVRRGIIMSTKKYLTPEDLGFGEESLVIGKESLVKGLSLQEVRMNAERELITSYLLKNHGHISKTAEEMQISRPTFHNLLKKLNINPKDYKRSKTSTIFIKK